MAATAADFRHILLAGAFAISAAVFASGLRLTATCFVLAFRGFFGHGKPPFWTGIIVR
jgi:hypothetical protein